MSFLKRIASKYSELISTAWSEFFGAFLSHLGFIFGSLSPADWFVSALVVFQSSLQRLIQDLQQVPFEIAAEIALEASDRIPNKKLAQRVMRLDSAVKMVFRIGAEKFKEAALWNSPPMIQFGLTLRSMVRDSLFKKLLKRFGGLIANVFFKSWTTAWAFIQIATRLWGIVFFSDLLGAPCGLHRQQCRETRRLVLSATN